VRGVGAVGQGEGALAGGVAPPVLEVLDERGQTGQGPGGGSGLVEVGSPLEGVVVGLLGEHVEGGGGLEPFDGGLDQGRRAKLPVSYGLRQPGQRTGRQWH